MTNSKVIDADGHIIERDADLRPYLKPLFDKRGGRIIGDDAATCQSIPGLIEEVKPFLWTDNARV
jgi:hypothetical protein